MNWLIGIIALIAIATLAMAAWRGFDRRYDQRVWQALVTQGGSAIGVFDPETVRDLPEPARRYFLYTIKPGAPLHRVVELDMRGELGLGTKDNPRYRAMSAHQILAPPVGLVWQLRAGAISGSDGATPTTSWTRFWLFGLVPVVRVGGTLDHRRSAFGRVVSEGAFWAPASLLPAENVHWTHVDTDTARAVVTQGDFAQAVDITVAADGQPTRVVIQRWSNVNPSKVFREQPFGGVLAEFRDFDGYRLPTHVEGGNHIGSDAYFPFFKANITAFRFPAAATT